MRSLVLIALAVATAPAESNPLLARTVQDNPPVQVWLNKRDNIDYGEAVRVYVRSEYDGHIVVLHADPLGRVRVLYPIDPSADDFIRGGRAYEIRNRQDHEAFRAIDEGGLGVVYVAYSQDPFRYADFDREGHWDFRVLGEINVEDNPEDELNQLVQQMAIGPVFDYDVADYYVTTAVDYGDRYRRYYGRSYFGRYYDPYYYDPYYYDPLYGPRFSFGIHLGFGFGSYYRHPYRRWGLFYDPFYWDPFYYDPFYYDPFYYGYGRYSYGYYPRYYCCGSTFVYSPRVFVGVNRHYTFKNVASGSGIGYRTRYRTAASSAIINSTNRRLLSSTPRQADAAVTDRRRPTNSAGTAGRRVIEPTPRTGSQDQRVVQDPRRAPERRVTGSDRRTDTQPGQRSGRIQSPTRRVQPDQAQPTRRADQTQTQDRRTVQATPRRRVSGTAENADASRLRAVPNPARRTQPEPRSATSGSRVTTRRPENTAAPERRGATARPAQPTDRRAAPRPSGDTRSTARPQLQRRSASTPRPTARPSSGSSSVRSSPSPSRSSASVRRPSSPSRSSSSVRRPSGPSRSSSSVRRPSSSSRSSSSARAPSRPSSGRSAQPTTTRRPSSPSVRSAPSRSSGSRPATQSRGSSSSSRRKPNN